MIDYKDWVIVHADGEWQVSDGPVGERCCSYDFDTKAEAEEYLKWLTNGKYSSIE